MDHGIIHDIMIKKVIENPGKTFSVSLMKLSKESGVV
jgi:hypothetical protein